MTRRGNRWLLRLAIIVVGFAASHLLAAPVAQDERFTLVRLQKGQSFADLAQIWLGDAREAWQISSINANQLQSPGQVVAVPRAPVNVSSVYVDGYRILPILCYHQFTDLERTAGQLEVTAAAFEQQIRYLIDNEFQILSFSELGEIVGGQRSIPDKAVVITIDDGYSSVFDVAWPILEKYDVKATLFIYTDFIGGSKALSWAQIQDMVGSGLVEIASHGKSHTSLSRLPSDSTAAAYVARVQGEIDGADAVFHKRLGASPKSLSYPYGNSSKTASDLYAKAGYALAATVTRGDNTVFSDPFLLHRTMIYDSHDLADFADFVGGFRTKNLQ